MTRIRIVFAMIVLAGAAQAEDWTEWQDATSAIIATTEGCRFNGTAAMSWPDGRQGLITFWQCCLDFEREYCTVLRCTDYFDTDMQRTGGLCAAAQ